MRPIRWQPGLDGLRALAVAAVIAYHIEPDAIPGGFLGVSVFFTLSGYLITSLLIDESRRSGRISIKDFWVRRARRLWPLAWSTLAVVGILALVGVYDEVGHGLVGEIGSALGQFANWWQLGHDGYVNQFGRPSPLRHMWSLSIEEQFYVVWPAVVWFARGRRGPLLAVAVVGSVASLAVTLLSSGADRIYLGTDTRAAELLIGAVLALLWAHRPLRGPRSLVARRACDVLAVVAFGALVPLVALVHPDDPMWAAGAFGLVAIGSAAMAAASVTRGVLRPVLSHPLLVWIGRRSYGLYLIHWPLWVALPIEWPFATRVAITVVGSLVLAGLAHRLVEQPVRERRVHRRALVAAGVFAVVAMFGGSTIAAAGGPSAREAVTETLDRVADPSATSAASTTTVPCPTTTTSAPTTTLPGVEGYKKTLDTLVDPKETLYIEACGAPVRVLVLGDSTARGLANGLAAVPRDDLQVWDRSTLSCSVGGEVGGERDCPDWRANWRAAVEEVRPDVVLFMMIPLVDLDSVDVSPSRFESAAEAERRRDVLGEAMEIAGSTGAEVAWARAPYLELPAGLYYCKGRSTNSICDREWVDLWNQAADVATWEAGATAIDTPGWAAPRPDPKGDRPDGVHFTGQALAELAEWIAPQLVALGR